MNYTPEQAQAVSNCSLAATCHVCAREAQIPAAIADARAYTAKTGLPTAVYWEHVPYDDRDPCWTWATMRDLSYPPMCYDVDMDDIARCSDDD